MAPELVEPDTVIIERVAAGEKFYLIFRGECSVQVGEDKPKKDAKRRVLRVGEYFGEISLLFGCATTARVTALKYCNLAVLDKQKFIDTLNNVAGIKDTILQRIYKYNDRLLRFIKKSIKRVPYL
jgi:CRP-like cAMP-binding protein